MALNLVNLDQFTRPYMLAEIDADIAAGKLYTGTRLNSVGVKQYPTLLKTAAQLNDDSWLASQLAAGNFFNATEVRNTKNGPVTAKVPVNAPEMLAEGEFNRFYLRGLCLRAIQQNITALVIYRAKVVSNPRPESEIRIGQSIDPKSLLADLRNHPGTETALGVPPGPNSGLSAKLP